MHVVVDPLERHGLVQQAVVAGRVVIARGEEAKRPQSGIVDGWPDGSVDLVPTFFDSLSK